jgi:uncharacterized protein (TIGR00255 family)
MTGFGQAEVKAPQGKIRVELKSTNHKFLEISTRIPGHLAEFEDGIRKKIGDHASRGKILLFVASPDPSVFISRLALNESLAKEVFNKTQQVQKMLKLSHVTEDAILREVLRYPDVLTKDTSSDKGSHYSQYLFKALEVALINLDRSRAQEGQALLKDLKGRVKEILASLKKIEKRIPIVAKEFKVRLKNRMQEFLKNEELDTDRLTGEVAQYVKNSDISEEVTRLKSHMDAMSRALAEKGELGRKIDFIAQEMTRETNTIGSKSADVMIAEAVIEIKAAIEKIREQAQNVE